MKTLLLVLLLLITGVVRAQTYQIDSVARFANIDDKVYKTTAEEIMIVLGKGTISFKGAYKLDAVMLDTLNVPTHIAGVTCDTYTIRNAKDSTDERLMNVLYVNGDPISVAVLTKDDKLIVFHIKVVLVDS